MDIRELAVERRRRRGGQEIGRDDPWEIDIIIQSRAYGRHGGRYNRLVQRRERHGQQNAEDDFEAVLLAERRGGGVVHGFSSFPRDCGVIR